jgi:pyridoxal phosphate enzyme (YggS family)
MIIAENVRSVLAEIPAGVELVAVAKPRTPQEVEEAIAAGAHIIGENYIQEAETAYTAIGNKARWHFIGTLQKNKVKKAVRLFDMIETVDSISLAQIIDKESTALGKTMPVLIEINSGREPQKSGVLPENGEPLIREIARLKSVKIMGLMTMGPISGDPQAARPYFTETFKLFKNIGDSKIAKVEMKHLSMGMSNSYKIAIEEGANMIRLGNKIFGERG